MTFRICVLSVVCVPETVRSPVTVTLPILAESANKSANCVEPKLSDVPERLVITPESASKETDRNVVTSMVEICAESAEN